MRSPSSSSEGDSKKLVRKRVRWIPEDDKKIKEFFKGTIMNDDTLSNKRMTLFLKQNKIRSLKGFELKKQLLLLRTKVYNIRRLLQNN